MEKDDKLVGVLSVQIAKLIALPSTFLFLFPSFLFVSSGRTTVYHLTDQLINGPLI